MKPPPTKKLPVSAIMAPKYANIIITHTLGEIFSESWWNKPNLDYNICFSMIGLCTKRNSVCCAKLIRNSVILFQIWFHSTRFGKNISACKLKQIFLFSEREKIAEESNWNIRSELRRLILLSGEKSDIEKIKYFELVIAILVNWILITGIR